MSNSGTWKPGQSGNPNGRPPKCRALTALLETAGRSTMLDANGRRRSRNRIVARILWDLLATGTAQMPDGEGGTREFEPLKGNEWFEIIKWLYKHVDGPPKLEMDVTSGDEPINNPATSLQGMAELVALYDALRARAMAQDNEGDISGDMVAADRPAE